MKKLTSKDVFALFVVFLILVSVGGYFFYQRIVTNKKIEEAKQKLQQIEQEIEKTKKFNEEEYAEKVTNLLNFENFVSTSTDIQLEGVEIIPKGDRKLVINHAEGYQIEIPKELILNRSWNTKSLKFDSLKAIKSGAPPRYWTSVFIFVREKDKWPQDFEEYYEELNRTSTPKIMINGVQFVKILVPGENPNDPDAAYYYKTVVNNKLYFIYVLSAKLFEDYIKTFKFITNE